MIDAYTIGITLALNNGVSEGLATVRRDLIALNTVVDGSATRLKHLTRATADLQIRPGITEIFKQVSTTPVRDRGGKTTPGSPDLSRLDPSLFAPSWPDMLLAATTLTPAFPSAAQPSADVGVVSVDRPNIMSSEVRSPTLNESRSLPVISQDWGQGVTMADFAPIHYPPQSLSATSTPVMPGTGSGGHLL